MDYVLARSPTGGDQIGPRRRRQGAITMAGISASIVRLTLPAVIGATLVGSLPLAADAAETISQQDAHAIGVAAYTYFYSLVTMDVTLCVVRRSRRWYRFFSRSPGGSHHSPATARTIRMMCMPRSPRGIPTRPSSCRRGPPLSRGRYRRDQPDAARRSSEGSVGKRLLVTTNALGSKRRLVGSSRSLAMACGRRPMPSRKPKSPCPSTSSIVC